MSAVEQKPNEASEAQRGPWDGAGPDPTIPLELELAEAEALRAWLLKPAADGTTSLDDQLVSRVLSRLGVEVDSARSAVNVRHELEQVGFSVSHLSDEQLRELGSRISQAAAPAPRT